MRYTVRPISDRTWLRPARERTGSRFDSTWASTKDLLGREIDLLRGRDVVLEVDVREQDIRQDGMLRANARSESSPAVVVAFESTHGPMLYRCDRFESKWSSQGPGWQQNVRAIALTLESLRAVDRYGATETGQQYAGFKALGAGRAMPSSHLTRTDAAEILERAAIGDEGAMRDRVVQRILDDPAYARDVLKHARAATHPDHRDGDRARWNIVEQAAAVLGVLS